MTSRFKKIAGGIFLLLLMLAIPLTLKFGVEQQQTIQQNAAVPSPSPALPAPFGPCANEDKLNDCHFDTRSQFNVNGELVESITAYGRGWNFDTSGNPWPADQSKLTNGFYLDSISRFYSLVITSTQTPIPTLQPTNVPTQVPTPIPTTIPTQTPIVQSVSSPVPTMPPTSTPIPPTARPTLLATGPNDTYLHIGIMGIITTVIGTGILLLSL